MMADLLENEEELFRLFWGFPRTNGNSVAENPNRVKKIIDDLTNINMADQVSDDDISFLVANVRNIETVPRRGKGDGNFMCKICPHLFDNSISYGLSSKERLKRHYQHHLQHHISRWKCSHCPHTHFQRHTMEQHLRRIHQGEGWLIELPRF
ncbi:Oidioi.mRNA.OKI2018_I69.chr2.g4981.t1.cds [Oikopleura dioica]|uniref:Oidioi.mRNA.OKI2018_I69.chr2.g4981.t1.cds n=1 Tax=Oikopleura dioica TaxID=34765 RepID=A0ABN7SZF6_OIKDI|nr:Oidioi.mRNA.OKI2018_I69.chr2.g4981.t1.cds [Oikopleura dioica]